MQHMEKLECIDLSHSQYLVRTPDFSGIPNLERLILEGCTDLREVHQSLGVLSKLTFLNLEDCKNLQCFPSSIELESLKVLILSGCSKLDKFPEILGYMPNLLELHLNGTAITELPSSIGYATQLVSLDMEDCKRFKSLPCCIYKLKSLKILKLSGCAKFESFPEILENMEGLRELFLDGTAIKELPLSVEHLNGLVLLNLRNCERLITLPSSICNLKSLSTLTLSGCSQLEKLPENLGNLECLVELVADGSAIIQPPSSIVLLRNLKVLSFQGCNGSPSGLWNSWFWSMLCLRRISDSTGFRLPSLSGLCSLKQLNLSDCNIKEGALPNDLGGYLSSLEYLNLKGNDFVTLPTGISKLCNLKALYLGCCKRLQELPMLPPNINRINAQNCTSLETLSGLSAPCWLAFTNSFRQNWGQETYLAEVSRIPKFNTYLPGNGIPEWFRNQCMGDSINIQLPSHWYNDNFLGFAMCIVFALREPNQCRRGAMLCELESSDLDPSNLGCFLDHIVWEGHSDGDGFVESDHLWLGYHPNFLIKKDDMDWPNKLTHIKASFVIAGIPHEVKWCGFRLVYMEDLNDDNSKITKYIPLQKKSSVVLQDLDESSTKDTIIHDAYYSGEGGPSGSLCSNKDLLTYHEAKPEESKTLVRKLLECFCGIWIDLLHSRNGSTSMESNYEIP